LKATHVPLPVIDPISLEPFVGRERVDALVEAGRSLVRDPHDVDGFGAALARVLRDRGEAERLARNGRRHIQRNFLPDRHLLQFAELLAELLSPPG
jgi:glycosyltransferase involved in cell wall biosynthesis